MKHCELGIGQIYYESYRFKLVDYLPSMYRSAELLLSQKPKEVISYDTIVIPFDKYLWFFMLGCMCAQFLVLVKMQQLYSSVTGKAFLKNFIYEGISYNGLHSYQKSILFCQANHLTN